MRETKSQELPVVYKQMRDYFKHMQAWKSDSSAEFSIEKLMKTSYFKNKEESQNLIDWSKMTVFGLYTCKQGSDKAIYRKAKYVANSCSSNKVIRSDRFVDVIRTICELASIKFMQAISETGYTEDFYNKSDYESIQLAINLVSQELKKEIFGESTEIDVHQWMMHALTPVCAWIFSYPSIRKKVHDKANIKMLHINQREAQRLFERLTR